MGTKYKTSVDLIFENCGLDGLLAGDISSSVQSSCSLELNLCILGDELVAAETKCGLLVRPRITWVLEGGQHLYFSALHRVCISKITTGVLINDNKTFSFSRYTVWGAFYASERTVPSSLAPVSPGEDARCLSRPCSFCAELLLASLSLCPPRPPCHGRLSARERLRLDFCRSSSEAAFVSANPRSFVKKLPRPSLSLRAASARAGAAGGPAPSAH